MSEEDHVCDVNGFCLDRTRTLRTVSIELDLEFKQYPIDQGTLPSKASPSAGALR